MAITKDTTTLPGQTIVTDSNGGVAIDYSPYYARIASALEGIENSLGSDSTTISGILASSSQALENIHQSLGSDSTTISGILASSSQALETLADLGKSKGIKTQTLDPLAWMGLMSVYKLYVEDPGAIGLEELKAYKAKIDELVASLEQ